MYMEVGAPHHVPHFHTYYQDAAAVFSLDPIDVIAGICRGSNGDLSRPGPSFINWSYSTIGTVYRRDNFRCQSIHWTKSMTGHPIHKVAAFRVVAPHKLEVEFDDGAKRVIDFLPVLAGELFGPLRNVELFNRVTLDAEVHTLVWPNGADFDPATLHDWDDHLPGMLALVRRWELNPA
jgi:hypothetical protein